MLLLREYPGPAELGDQLRGAHAVTAGLMWDVFGEACRLLPCIRQPEKAAHIERLIASEAWTDAALALIDLALPRWQVRRTVYDDGEWYCALSRGRELPDWLDRSIESRHADLALALLSAYVEARGVAASSGRPSVPTVSRDANQLYVRLCCDNFA